MASRTRTPPRRHGRLYASEAVPAPATLDALVRQLHARFPRLRPEMVRSELVAGDAAARVIAAIDAHFERYGLSQVRFMVLMLLYHFTDRAWTPSAVANTIGMHRSTLTGVLDVLEGDGWVERRAHPEDGRSLRLRMTRSGRRRFARVMDDHFTRVIAAFDGIGAREYAELRGEMKQLVEVFEGLHH